MSKIICRICSLILALSVVITPYAKDEWNDYEAPSTNQSTNIPYSLTNASHNKLATVALMKMGNQQPYDSSATFISKCSREAGLTDIVPLAFDYEEWEQNYRDLDSFYDKNSGFIPCAGDIVLFDTDGDSYADHAEIVSLQLGNLIYTVGLNEHQIVDKHVYKIQDERICGVCHPDYNIILSSECNFKLNAVSSSFALRKQAHADILAKRGVEVIARSINPESKSPLTRTEAQLYFNAGIRVMMMYNMGDDAPYRGYDFGYYIGTQALSHARNLNAPKGIPIFFCCDCPSRPLSYSNVAEFLRGVHDAMNGEYGVGLYGGYHVTEAMYNLGVIDAYWQDMEFSNGYVSNHYDVIQWSNDRFWFNEIPYKFKANQVVDIEKVSYILD